MSYSKSKHAIRRVESYLAELVKSQGEEVSYQPKDAHEFSYQLRDGIKASKHHALDNEGNSVEPYASYQALDAQYKICIKDNLVVCKPRILSVVPRVKQVFRSLSIPEVKDTLGVIGAAIKHRAPVMEFPDANIDTVDFERVARWAAQNGYTINISPDKLVLTGVKNNNASAEECATE